MSANNFRAHQDFVDSDSKQNQRSSISRKQKVKYLGLCSCALLSLALHSNCRADNLFLATNPGGPMRFWRTNSDTRFYADRNLRGGPQNPQYGFLDGPDNGDTSKGVIPIAQNTWNFRIGLEAVPLAAVPGAPRKATVTLTLDGSHNGVHPDEGVSMFTQATRTKKILMRAIPRFNRDYFLAKNSIVHGNHKDKYRVSGHMEASPTMVAIGDLKVKAGHKKRERRSGGGIVVVAGDMQTGSDEIALAFNADTGEIGFSAISPTYATAVGNRSEFNSEFWEDPIATSWISGEFYVDPFSEGHIVESRIRIDHGDDLVDFSGALDEDSYFDMASGTLRSEMATISYAGENLTGGTAFMESLLGEHEFAEGLSGFEADIREGLGFELQSPHLAELTNNFTQSVESVPATIHFGGLALDVPLGDYNHNGVLDPTDLDELVAVASCYPHECLDTVDGNDFLVWQRGNSDHPISFDDLEQWQHAFGLVTDSYDPRYDVTGDQDAEGSFVVDLSDVQHWVEELYGTVMGDINLDGTLDVTDLAILEANWGSEEATWSTGDLDANGQVNQFDFDILVTNFGSMFITATTVPEPDTLVLGLMGLLASITRRRRTCATVAKLAFK